MNVQWIRIVSWHIFRLTRSIEPRTQCGRTGRGAVMDTRPDGKTCETCLRWLARQVDA